MYQEHHTTPAVDGSHKIRDPHLNLTHKSSERELFHNTYSRSNLIFFEKSLKDAYFTSKKLLTDET